MYEWVRPYIGGAWTETETRRNTAGDLSCYGGVDWCWPPSRCGRHGARDFRCPPSVPRGTLAANVERRASRHFDTRSRGTASPQWRDRQVAGHGDGDAARFAPPRMIERAIFYLDEAVESAARLMVPEIRRDLSGVGLVTREPVGVVGGDRPRGTDRSRWSIAKIMPALAVGCTVVLKPPLETPLSCFFIAEACQAAGMPPGVLNILPGGAEVGEYLVRHRDIDIVSFTGSSAVGRRIGQVCGGDLKRVCLELGGQVGSHRVGGR